MIKVYSNGGSYEATCLLSKQGNLLKCGCNTQCTDCQYMISNIVAIEGEYLPEKITICGMEYNVVEERRP